MAIVTATATDDEVFRAFVLGDDKVGDTARSETWFGGRTGYRSVAALFSHDVLIALRSEECVVFDAAPCRDGGRCTCRYVKDAGKAFRAARVHYDESEVSYMDHGAFVDLATRLGALA